MKLSIITVCFNADNTIEKTIKSILEQTFTEFEWVVVDGKSTDTTNEIIKKYLPEFERKGVKVNYCSENDKGIYDAMNKGAQRATGEYLTYMNADDLYYKNDSIERVITILENTSADIVYGDCCFIKSTEQYIEKAKDIETITYHLPFCPQAAFVKSELQRQLQFDTQFRISADYDFFLRAYLQEKKFQRIDQVVAYFTFGGASNENLIKTYKEDVAVKVKNGLEKRNSIVRKIKYMRFILVNKIRGRENVE